MQSSDHRPIKFVHHKDKCKPENAVPMIHSIPCKIQSDGPANVGPYFESSRRSKTDGAETAMFRGRPLNGWPLEVFYYEYLILIIKIIIKL